MKKNQESEAKKNEQKKTKIDNTKSEPKKTKLDKTKSEPKKAKINKTESEPKKEKVDKTKNKQKKTKKEKSETKEMIKVKNKYFLGTIGAILGSLVTAIPLILVYVYGNIVLSALSIIIAVGAFYGYKLFGGRTTKAVPVIVIITSILITVLTLLVLMPLLYIYSQGADINISNIKYLYEDLKFLETISFDAIITMVFSIAGAVIMTIVIRRKIKNENTNNITLSNPEELEKIKLDSIDKIKPIFERFNALGKENGILKDELYAEIDEDNELKTAFKNLKSFGIIKKSKGKFYYSEELEDKEVKIKKKKINSKVITVIIGIIFIGTMIGMVVYNQIKIHGPQEVTDNVIKFTIDGDWTQGMSYYENEWSYYKYINSTQPEGQLEEGDYEKYPATIDVMYFENDIEEIPDIETVGQIVKDSIMSQELTPETYEENVETTDKGYSILKLKLIYKSDYESIEYVNYIFKGDMLATVDSYSYNMKDESELKETIDKITESFDWI